MTIFTTFELFARARRSALAVLVGLGIGAGGAHAAPIVLDFDAQCLTDCSVVGLADNSSVNGSITFDDTNFGSIANITTADIISFAFAFGTFSITDATAAAFDFCGTLDGTGTSFSSFFFGASTAVTPSTGTTLSISESAGFASENGTCLVLDCSAVQNGRPQAVLGTGSLAVLRQEELPEPGALALIGLGLAGLGFARRRTR